MFCIFNTQTPANSCHDFFPVRHENDDFSQICYLICDMIFERNWNFFHHPVALVGFEIFNVWNVFFSRKSQFVAVHCINSKFQVIFHRPFAYQVESSFVVAGFNRNQRQFHDSILIIMFRPNERIINYIDYLNCGQTIIKVPRNTINTKINKRERERMLVIILSLHHPHRTEPFQYWNEKSISFAACSFFASKSVLSFFIG